MHRLTGRTDQAPERFRRQAEALAVEARPLALKRTRKEGPFDSPAFSDSNSGRTRLRRCSRASRVSISRNFFRAALNSLRSAMTVFLKPAVSERTSLRARRTISVFRTIARFDMP